MPDFNDLPIAIQALIRDHLPLPDVASLSTVSHGMYALANNKLNWQNKLKTNFPHIYSTLTGSYNDTDYKEIFKENYGIEYADLTQEQRNLFSFVKENDVESLIKSGIRKNDLLSITDTNKLNLLDWAKKNNNQSVLNYFFELILKESSPEHVDKADKLGYCLFHWAVLCNQPGYVEILLIAGANPKVALKRMHFQPIHLAAQAGQLDIVKVIVENDPSMLNEQDACEQTPLLWASATGHADVAQYLLEKGPNLEAASNVISYIGIDNGKTPLYWAVERGHAAVVEKLMARGANAKLALGGMRFQPLHLAAQAGRLDIVKIIVENDPSTLDEQDAYGQTALLWACVNGHADVALYLLEKGANLETASNRPGDIDHGKTPLYWAVERGHASVVEKLMARGANAKLALGYMRSQPIHLAAQAGRLDIVKILVENDPSTLDQDAYGETALLRASTSGHADVVLYLLDEKGANLETATNQPRHWYLHGITPLYSAVKQGHASVVEKLMARGANAKVARQDMIQPLHFAAGAGRLDIVKILVENDPSTLDEQDADGQTALLWASGHADVVAYLFNQGAAGFKTGISTSANEDIHFKKFQTLDKLAQKIILTANDSQNEQRNDLLEFLKQEAIKVYQKSNDSVDQSHTKLQAMSDKFEKLNEFTERLNEMSLQAKSLQSRGHVIAANRAHTLSIDLQNSAKSYLNDVSPTAYESFSASCSGHIQIAKPTLEEHRGWKCLLGNLALAILGAGVGYVIAGCINKAETGHFLFFNKTRSKEKLDALSQTLDKLETPQLTSTI